MARATSSGSPIKRSSFACPALPTCGLALTESERALPGVLDELEAELDALGLGGLDAHVRMTGCPNGCSRPYTAEIGLVGRGKKNYDIHLGGEPVGIRLNDVFAENVPRDELVNVLRPVLAYYRDQRRSGGAVRRLLPPPGCRSAAGATRHRALGTQAAGHGQTECHPKPTREATGGMMRIPASTVHGFPRIGPNRELKKATEGFWHGRVSSDQLAATGRQIRTDNWARMVACITTGSARPERVATRMVIAISIRRWITKQTSAPSPRSA